MTPKAHEEEDRRLVALIRALEADMHNPLSLQESIERDEAQLAAIKARIDAARERHSKLPQLLQVARDRLKVHRLNRPDVDAKLKKLLKLKEMMNELLKDIQGDSNG
jgi:chromosome segregation ATPase